MRTASVRWRHAGKHLKAIIARRARRRQLLERLPKNGVGAEIGTWKGDFAEQLLRNLRPVTLHLVDPWEYRPEPAYKKAAFGDRVPGGQERMDGIHDGVMQRFDREIAAGRVVVHRTRSVDAAAGLEPLDWVYVDGDHTYEAVKADLEAYFPLVKPGGAIAGDDYGLIDWWQDGVRRAVDEFVAERPCELSVLGEQFIIVKPV